VVEALAAKGLRVVCAGLDQDYQGKPFEPMASAPRGGRVHHQGIGHLRGVRQPGQPQPASLCFGRTRGGGGCRGLRSALPASVHVPFTGGSDATAEP